MVARGNQRLPHFSDRQPEGGKNADEEKSRKEKSQKASQKKEVVVTFL
jgi:hypothetical protein